MLLTEKQKSEGWRIVKFGEIAKSVSKRVDPSETELEVYVGLEHLDPDNLRITRRGVPSDVKGQKLLVKPGRSSLENAAPINEKSLSLILKAFVRRTLWCWKPYQRPLFLNICHSLCNQICSWNGLLQFPKGHSHQPSNGKHWPTKNSHFRPAHGRRRCWRSLKKLKIIFFKLMNS